MPMPHVHRFPLILAGVDISADSAHAMDPLWSAAAARAYAERPLVGDVTAELQHFVSRTLGAADAADVECSVIVGAARHVRIHECRRRHADSVALGSQGRGGLSKVFFGSTTEGLLRRYRGAVMIVPPRCPGPDAAWPGGSIVAAVASGLHHRAMMSAAARTAEVFGAWLT